MFRVATWNVNSVRIRMEHLLDLLDRSQFDVLCLQEIKCVAEEFPSEDIVKHGYYVTVVGQKSYNGVATISRQKPIKTFLSLHDNEVQSRFLVCEFPEMVVANGYIPNGQDLLSEKFIYKLQWLERAKSFFQNHYTAKDPILFVGDFNITPDDRDVYDATRLRGRIHCSLTEREALANLMEFGFSDLFRIESQPEKIFSWWDYREFSFEKNQGLRIDLILGTKQLAQKCHSVKIISSERQKSRPSDHAPVVGEFNL